MTTIGTRAEGLVVEGRMRCIKCSELKLPGEMHSENGLCQACYDALKVQNAGKRKPKGRPKIDMASLSSIGLGWKEREEKPIRTVSPDYYKPKSRDGIRVPDTNNGSYAIDTKETTSSNSIRVSDTNNEAAAIDNGITAPSRGIIVPDTRRELTDNDCDTSIAENGIRVPETEGKPPILDSGKSVHLEGIMVSDTKIRAIDGDADKSIAEIGIKVSETERKQSLLDSGKSACTDGIKVSDTEKKALDDDTNESVAETGIRVSETAQKRIDGLENSLGFMSQMLADAVRRIKILEEKLSPVIEKEDAKKDAAGLKKLRDDLHRLLQDNLQKKKIDGIYVHSLYGPKGRKGGKLGISKMQAFRLRDACRTDSRFRVERAGNQRGNWVIRLNLYMK